jgi:GTP-binding protein
MVFDLFVELGATDEQLDFPVIYASAKEGYAVREIHEARDDMEPLFDAIINRIPPPERSKETYFRMLVSNLDYSDYLGRLAFGRLGSGRVSVGDSVVLIHKDGRRERTNVTALFSHEGLERIEVKRASAGDIIGLAGFEEVNIGETITDLEERPALEFVDIDPPTIQMNFVVNDSPLSGKEGKFLTARHIKERLVRECRTNVSLQFEETDSAGVFTISARGEMQIAILVEEMRREGFELLVSRPEVILKKDERGNLLEPFETLYVDVPNENLGDILQSLAVRKAEILSMDHQIKTVLVEALIPTRGLIGFESDLVNLTRGLGSMSHLFKEYGPFKGEIATRHNGVLVAMESGLSTAYALNNVQERGRLFVGPQEEIYEGMVVGENSRPGDLAVNPCKAKHLTNMRSQGEGKGIQLAPPIRMSLERSLEYISSDEYIEATPKTLRFRKKILNSIARKRAGARTGK